MKRNILHSCVAALVLAVAFPAAGQSVLISIYEANPSAVTFTASSANSFAASSVNNSFGVDLISYFTSAPALVGGTVTGTLTPTGTSPAYNGYFPDNYLNGVSSVDLNLYVTTTSAAQAFVTTSPAFTGTATINLSSLIALLPSVGATGNIYSGDIRSPGTLIGTWVVVPEPPVGVLMALGATVFAGLAFVRRARHAAARR